VVKLLALGGPAEGEMLEDNGFYNEINYAEKIPSVWKKADYEDPAEPSITVHTYRRMTLIYSDTDKYLPAKWQKSIWVHSSLTNEAATERLREFLVITFIKMSEVHDDVK
jgi:hypothetical protein